MRDIKFRAWLEEDGGKMIYQSDNTASAMNGLAAFAHNVGQAKNHTPHVMQYTGLKDKNGKEIYEGDVARVGDSDPPRVMVCVYTAPCYWWNKKRDSYSGEWAGYEIEVIGNSYENPELLEKNN
ncbi:MAG: YopX family protein [Burkholderiaceae bacterium]